jgi:hypothetical protein
MADNEDIEDRFTTYWSGPYDDRTMEYAARHGISYDIGAGSVIQLGPGMYINRGGGTDLEALRRANRASDAETRALHAQDTEISTGTSVFTANRDRWIDCTRGCKFRTTANERRSYSEYLTWIINRKVELHDILGTLPGKEPETTQFFYVDEAISLARRALDLVRELEVKVEDETEPGWEWEKGIDEQKEVRARQHENSRKMD